jgi:hypothetical protein
MWDNDVGMVKTRTGKNARFLSQVKTLKLTGGTELKSSLIKIMMRPQTPSSSQTFPNTSLIYMTWTIHSHEAFFESSLFSVSLPQDLGHVVIDLVLHDKACLAQYPLTEKSNCHMILFYLQANSGATLLDIYSVSIPTLPLRFLSQVKSLTMVSSIAYILSAKIRVILSTCIRIPFPALLRKPQMPFLITCICCFLLQNTKKD